MPGRVGVLERVVEHVALAVEGLGVARLRHHRIRADEAAQQRVVEPRPVVIQPYCTLFKLACKAAAGGGGAAGVAGLPVGAVAQLAHLNPAAVHGEGGGAQVIGEQVVQGTGLAQGHPLAVLSAGARTNDKPVPGRLIHLQCSFAGYSPSHVLLSPILERFSSY